MSLMDKESKGRILGDRNSKSRNLREKEKSKPIKQQDRGRIEINKITLVTERIINSLFINVLFFCLHLLQESWEKEVAEKTADLHPKIVEIYRSSTTIVTKVWMDIHRFSCCLLSYEDHMQKHIFKWNEIYTCDGFLFQICRDITMT